MGATLFGLLGYAVIHILPNPTTYFTLDRLIYGPTHLPPIVAGSPSLLLGGLQDELGLLLSTYLLGFVVVVWAAIAFAGSRKRNERVLSVLGLALVLSQALLIRNKLPYYAILVTPGLDLLVAAFLLRWVVEAIQAGSRAAKVAAVLSVLAILVSCGVALLPLRWDGYQNYVQVQDRIDEDVRPADVIMASQVYWFGLHLHKYYSWEQLVYFQRDSPGCGLWDAMAHFRPDLFVVDGHLQEFITDPGQPGLYSGLLALPRAELNKILAEHATLVDQFDGGGYGQVSIYRLNWHDSSQAGSPGSSACPG